MLIILSYIFGFLCGVSFTALIVILFHKREDLEEVYRDIKENITEDKAEVIEPMTDKEQKDLEEPDWSKFKKNIEDEQ